MPPSPVRACFRPPQGQRVFMHFFERGLLRSDYEHKIVSWLDQTIGS